MGRFRGQAEHDDVGPTQHGRNRRPISCLPCRHRKLRCDRSLPACGNCVNRGNITACCYVSRKPEPRANSQPLSDLSKSAQDKIDHLEHLVLTLLKSQRNVQGRPDTPASSVSAEVDGACDPGDGDANQQVNQADRSREESSLTKTAAAITIAADYKQSHSVDEAHWALLLNEIGEVRSYLHAQQTQYEDQTRKIAQLLRRSSDDPGPALLFGPAKNVTRSEIISQLPSKYSCDMIIRRFFSHMYPAIYILHGPTFHKQYEDFWVDQSKTSNVWIGLLFSMLRIGVLDYLREGDEPVEFKGKCQDLANNFRNRLTDCLILADYMQPQDFLIETLIMHLYAEYVASRDSKSGVWVLIGMIARLAMRMGYHQPSQPALTSTPFQTEMRRRAWAFIRQADIMLSFQVGLPSMTELQAIECPLPRNIHDDERFGEDCTVLPPALADSEPTQISYLIAKTKLVFGFARAVKEVNRPGTIRWERILEIDRELRYIYDNVPDHYKLGPLSDQDSLVLISARFVLSSIHHKSLCVVHSRFLEVAKSDYRYLYSRRVCLSSAMSILRFQAIQNQDIPVDGKMRSLTNYQTSLAIHDYLLAATIISADLCSAVSADRGANPNLLHGIPTRAEMIKALSISARIFGQMRDQSMEAFKAADVLGMLVKKLEGEDYVATQSPSDSQFSKVIQASRVQESNSTAKSSSLRQQIPTRASPIASEQSPLDGLSGGTGVETMLTGHSEHAVRSPSRVAWGLQPDKSMLQGSRTSEGPDSSAGWTGSEPNGKTPHAQIAASPHRFSDFDVSGNWTIAEEMELFGQSIMDEGISASTSLGDVTPMPYSAALALNDPMSILWNLSSGT